MCFCMCFFQNILHLVHIMLVLPVSSAVCERGFSSQKRIKYDVRASLHTDTVEDLIQISVEGPSLEDFDARKCGKLVHPRVKGQKATLHVLAVWGAWASWGWYSVRTQEQRTLFFCYELFVTCLFSTLYISTFYFYVFLVYFGYCDILFVLLNKHSSAPLFRFTIIYIMC